MILIPAIQKDDSLLADIDTRANLNDGFDLWWLGQSGYLLQWQGKRVLIDPYLSDSLTKKYAQTDKPHTRMSERVIDPSLLRDICIVTSSHNHTDHLDAETLQPVLENNPGIKFIIPEANRRFVAGRVKCEESFPIGLSDVQSVVVEGFTIHGIPAKHNEIERDERGNCKYMGYVFQFGPYCIYHSGDTLWFDGLVDIVKHFTPDVALLPINGNDITRGVAGNLDTREAALLGTMINAGFVIPCHYDMFSFNTADVTHFINEAKAIDQPYHVLGAGERFTFINRKQ